MNSDTLHSRIKQMLMEITEHFPDAHVQVLVTFSEDGITKSIKPGIGNWYARQGLCHEFINEDIAQENARQIADKINPPEDGEDWKKDK